jgi:hypothetical protein
MIGRRGFPTLEPPRAWAGPTPPEPVRQACRRMRIASRPCPRAPPVEAPALHLFHPPASGSEYVGSPEEDENRSPVTERAVRIRDVITMPAPDKALGQRRRR